MNDTSASSVHDSSFKANGNIRNPKQTLLPFPSEYPVRDMASTKKLMGLIGPTRFLLATAIV